MANQTLDSKNPKFQENKGIKIGIWVFTFVVFTLVALMGKLPKPDEAPFFTKALPAVNAIINFSCFLTLIASFIMVKRKNVVIYEKPKVIKELKFKDLNLQDVDLTNKKGNIMILNFWASWCAPCKREMPSLEKLGAKLPEIDIFAVNMEKPNNIKVDKFF